MQRSIDDDGDDDNGISYGFRYVNIESSLFLILSHHTVYLTLLRYSTLCYTTLCRVSLQWRTY